MDLSYENTATIIKRGTHLAEQMHRVYINVLIECSHQESAAQPQMPRGDVSY